MARILVYQNTTLDSTQTSALNLTLITDVLTVYGHEIVPVTHVDRAYDELIKSTARRFDLFMPDWGGPTSVDNNAIYVAREIAGLLPEQILITTASKLEWLSCKKDGTLGTIIDIPVLFKPFGVKTLVNRVSELLQLVATSGDALRRAARLTPASENVDFTGYGVPRSTASWVAASRPALRVAAARPRLVASR